MSNFLLIAALAVVAVWAAYRTIRRARRGGGCCGERESAVARVQAKDRDRSHYPYQATLAIGGMTCENCARRVENALNGLDGVWAKVDIGSHRAAVRTKTPPDENALREAVRQAGYVVTQIDL